MEKAAGEATIESDGFRKGRDRESAFVQFVDWRSIILFVDGVIEKYGVGALV
jgi:hypothetical protein